MMYNVCLCLQGDVLAALRAGELELAKWLQLRCKRSA
jgi:hypothetical protein